MQKRRELQRKYHADLKSFEQDKFNRAREQQKLNQIEQGMLGGSLAPGQQSTYLQEYHLKRPGKRISPEISRKTPSVVPDYTKLSRSAIFQHYQPKAQTNTLFNGSPAYVQNPYLLRAAKQG